MAQQHPEIGLFIGQIRWYTLAIQTERVMAMYTIKYVHGHVQVYDYLGKFLFSADSEREAREELKDYAQCAA